MSTRRSNLGKRMKAEGAHDTKQVQWLESYVVDTRLMIDFIQEFIGNMSEQVNDLSEATEELGLMLGLGETKAQVEEDKAAATARSK